MQFDYRGGLVRNSLKIGFEESLSELFADITDGRCPHRDGTWLTGRRESRGLIYRKKGTKWQAAACLHMVDKRRPIQLKLLP